MPPERSQSVILPEQPLLDHRRHKHKSRKETEEERRERKERERRERKERERKQREEEESAGTDDSQQHIRIEEIKPEDEEAMEQIPKDEPMDFESAEEEEEEEEEEEPVVSKLLVQLVILVNFLSCFSQSHRSKGKKRKTNDFEDEDFQPEEEELSRSREKKQRIKQEVDYEEEEEDYKPAKKKAAVKKTSKKEPAATASPTKKGGKKPKVEEEVWRWWEEKDKPDDGTKWKFLEHKGPLFAPPYDPLPENVRFYYDGKRLKLSLPTEEVATFYGRMLDHDYTTKDVFNRNFFKDWRKVMNQRERETIRDLSKCDFNEINDHFKKVSEERKARSKEEKKAEKEKNEAIQKEYGFCSIDGHKEKIGNFRIEPPGLFRGRGEHPKQGMLKKRVMPEDVIINCSADSKHPEPPKGHKWKNVQHDNTVSFAPCTTVRISICRTSVTYVGP